MSYNPQNPNAQATMANSSPVVIASDQSAVPVTVGVAATSLGKAEDAVHTSGDTGVMALGVRQDADTSPVGADGRYHGMIFNSLGRLKVSTQPGDITATTGNITTASGTVTANISRASNVMIQVAGTYAGVNLTFEGSVDNGTTFFIVQAVRSDANTIETTSGVIASTTRAWELSVNAMTNVRVRSTAYVSGTAAITILPGVYATEPIPAAQVSATQPVSGTVTATVTGATLAIPVAIADVTSAAITTTTTTATLIPTAGNSYQVVIPVTVVSGTTPTMIVRIEESDDTGTNWFTRFTFATIIATGIYRSPILKLRGNRVRYVQTIAGTTPSFTRAINRNQRTCTSWSGFPAQLVSAATTNATSVLAAPCELTKLTASNVNAAARYLKIYDKASAPTVGTDIPVATYILPGNATGAGTNIPLTIPDSFQFGFAFAITVEATVAGATAVAANEIVINYSLA